MVMGFFVLDSNVVDIRFWRCDVFCEVLIGLIFVFGFIIIIECDLFLFWNKLILGLFCGFFLFKFI